MASADANRVHYQASMDLQPWFAKVVDAELSGINGALPEALSEAAYQALWNSWNEGLWGKPIAAVLAELIHKMGPIGCEFSALIQDQDRQADWDELRKCIGELVGCGLVAIAMMDQRKKWPGQMRLFGSVSD